MAYSDSAAIGQRIKMLRRRKHLKQAQMAQLLGKSLRTVQKYETGEIEVSISVVRQLAQILDSTPAYILDYEVEEAPISTMADIARFLFHLENVTGIHFDIGVEKPPHSPNWKCSLTFDGKDAQADDNANMCLLMEQWAETKEKRRICQISQKEYEEWQKKILLFCGTRTVHYENPQEIPEEERIRRYNDYLRGLYTSAMEEKPGRKPKTQK